MFRITFTTGHIMIVNTVENHRFTHVKGFRNDGEFYIFEKSVIQKIEII